MGSMCTVSVQNLPTSTKAVTGTQLPQWVSEGGTRLFQQSAELAKSPYPQYTGARVATYGDGQRLSPEEQRAMGILGRDSYSQFMNQAGQAAGQLGQGYRKASTQDLLGYDSSRNVQFQPTPQFGEPVPSGPFIDPIEFGTGGEPIPPKPFVDPIEQQQAPSPITQQQAPSPMATQVDYVSPGYRGATRQELLGAGMI